MDYSNLRTKFKLFLSGALFMALTSINHAQIQPEWDASLGGNIWEELNSVEQTADGGFIMAGFTSSSQDADVSGMANGGGDYWVVKTDNLGQIEWENNFGGNQLERPWKVLPTTDGGYMVAGYSPSNISGDKSENSRGGDDYWVVKMDNTGNFQWDKTYGGDGLDFCYDMIQLNDGGFLLGGRSLSGISGEKTEVNKGNWDFWLVKIDATGNFIWDKTIGGDQEDLLTEMQLSPDGNVVIGGGTSSSMSGDVTSMTQGDKDFWLVKVNSNDGDLMWQRRYGGTNEDEMFSFVQTSDGGFLLGGGSRSDANPPYKSENNFGIVDMWIVKTGALGAVQWDRTFGGDGLDNCYSVRQNSIDYYIISGFSDSNMTGNKTTPTNGGFDYWMLYLDENGTKKWESSLGGAQNDVLEKAFQIDDGGYLLAGHSSSDVSGDKVDPSNGNNDFWIIKTICDLDLDLTDMLVCPNEPVLLDTYTGTDCVGCTWTWGDLSTTDDSIRLITTDVTTTYNVTLTDGVGCSREDEVTITIIPTSINLNLDDAVTLCSGQSTVLNAENSGNDYNWSNGGTTQIINVSTSDTYTVSVTDNNMCTFVDSTVVTVLDELLVDLGNDTTICANFGNFILNAGNPGLDYEWSPGGETTQVIPVNAAGTYSVTVTGNASCTGTDEIIVAVFDAPIVLSTMTPCNDTNTFYTVVLEIGGGDVNTYNITGTGGSFNGNIFTSVDIPKDGNYTFFLGDGSGCPPTSINGSYDCDCVSTGGFLTPGAISICGDSITVEVQVAATTDANDIVQYALHENAIFDNNTIVYFRDTPNFDFQLGMVYGQTYFVTALSGNELPVGSILLEDACLGMSNTIPVTFNRDPIIVVESQTSLELTCENPTLVLDGSNSTVPDGGPIFYNWDATNGGNITGNPNVATVNINAAGTYHLTVTNLAGCTAVDSLAIIDDAGLPLVSIIMPPPLSCRDTLVILDATASDNGPEYTIQWIGAGIAGDTSLNPSVAAPGLYLLTITNTLNGCSRSQPVTVLANYDTPTANVNPIHFMNCTTGMVTMQASAFPPEPVYLVEWTTEDGEIISGGNDFTAVGGDIGLYEVLITDSISGCSNGTATTILPNQFRPRSAFLKWTFPLCLGDSNGTMRVDSVLSGTAPFEYSFNGLPFSIDTFNNQLSAGENNIVVRDFFGCLWDTTVVFRDGRELLVDLEELYGFVELGDSVQLMAFGSEDIETIVWESPIALSCDDCLSPWIRPTDDSISIAVQLFTEDGCTNRDSIQVKVSKFRRVYIPNAFTPNGNRKNEFFSVFTNKETKRINYLKVYNRWGGLIYKDQGLTLEDKKNGWDGNYKNGRAALPGIYIYIVEVEFWDGEVRQYRGDFTLYK